MAFSSSFSKITVNISHKPTSVSCKKTEIMSIETFRLIQKQDIFGPLIFFQRMIIHLKFIRNLIDQRNKMINNAGEPF